MICTQITGYTGAKPTIAEIEAAGVRPVIYVDRQWYQNNSTATGTLDLNNWASYCRSLSPGTVIVMDVECRFDRPGFVGVRKDIRLSNAPHSASGFDFTNEEVDEDCAWYKTLVDVFRANADPTCLLYSYDVLFAPYWAARSTSAQVKADVQAANDYAAPRLGNYFDGIIVHAAASYYILHPSELTYEPTNWKVVLGYGIRESLRAYPDKKVLIHLWPRYGPQVSEAQFQIISSEFWDFMVDQSRLTGHDIAVWESGLGTFDYNFPWWVKVKQAAEIMNGGWSPARLGQAESTGDPTALFRKRK